MVAAQEAVRSGDSSTALKKLADVVQSVKGSQKIVRVSSEAHAEAVAAKEAIKEGNSVEAVEKLEAIVSQADQSVTEIVGEDPETELPEVDPFVGGLEQLAEAL